MISAVVIEQPINCFWGRDTHMDYICYMTTVAIEIEFSINADELMLALCRSLSNVSEGELENISFHMVLEMMALWVKVNYRRH